MEGKRREEPEVDSEIHMITVGLARNAQIILLVLEDVRAVDVRLLRLRSWKDSDGEGDERRIFPTV